MEPIKEIDQRTVDILENFLDNMMIYNREGMLLYACEKFWRDTGLDRKEFHGKGIGEIVRLNVYNPCAAEMAFKTGEKTTVVQRAFLDEISVATALPIRDKQGEIFLYVTYAENNERIIELEDKLAQLNRFIQEKDEEISQLLTHRFFYTDHVGESKEVLKVHKLIDRIVDFDANVLLMGETGVGKTMYAEKIHSKGKRRALPFVEINCAAIPETLLESELFGYEKGAFTGANEKGKKGQIELAAGGTLFLDEISELSMNLQSKLLKVIQDKKVLRIGGTEPIEVDFRLITASNRNLQAFVKEGKFRADLFYRLNVIPINIPALRDRKEDIHPLAKYFLEVFNKKYGENKFLSRRTIPYLIQYDWPGNVRELENMIERLVLTVEKEEIDLPDLPQYQKGSLPEGIDEKRGLQNILDALEKEILTKTFQEANGNVSLMARKLQMSRQSVLRRMKKYAL